MLLLLLRALATALGAGRRALGAGAGVMVLTYPGRAGRWCWCWRGTQGGLQVLVLAAAGQWALVLAWSRTQGGGLALLVEAGALRPRVRGVVVDLRTPAAARTAAHEIVCAYACVRVCAVLHGRVAVRVCATFCAGRRGDGALWP